MTRPSTAPTPAKSSQRIVVALVLSRLLGIVRDKVLFALAGLAATNDILTLALKAANTLQNLLGEQALSAAFIPAYSQRLGDGRVETPESARRLAGAAFAWLLLIAGGLGLAGTLFAPHFAWLFREKGEEAISLLTLSFRFLFPMATLLVLASWCLSVLSSHRRFFLPYIAPALWNFGVLAGLGLLSFRFTEPSAKSLVLYFSVGSLVGGALQLLVQFPKAISVNGGLPLSLSPSVPGIREVQRRFAPVLLGRGSLQVIGLLEAAAALRFLSDGSVAALGGGQRLFFLTLMVTSMVQAIVYLPEFARIDDPSALNERFREALHGVWFLVVPTMFGVIALGFPLIAALFRGGKFGLAENALVYLVFCSYIVGLVPTASSRMLQALLYSRGETRLPAVLGGLRAASSLAGAWLAMHWWDGHSVNQLASWLGFQMPASRLTLGALAFATTSAVAAHVEWFVLRQRSGMVGSLQFLGKAGLFTTLSVLALVPTAVAWFLYRSWSAPGWWFLLGQGLVVVAVYGASYLLLARQLRVEEFERLAGVAKVGNSAGG